MEEHKLRAYKERILKEICTILRDKYHQDCREIAEYRILELLSERDQKSLAPQERGRYVSIGYFLDFRNDQRFLELHEAYRRIQQGNYGLCLCCGNEISDADLDRNPCKRICPRCELSLKSGEERHS